MVALQLLSHLEGDALNVALLVPDAQRATRAALVRTGDLEALLRRLLPTAPVQTPPPRPVPTEMANLLECLRSKAPAPAPTARISNEL